MKSSPLHGLIVRTCVCRNKDVGFIYAGDLDKERNEIPHTITFRWKSGDFARGESNFDVHTACLVDYPEFGLIYASEVGSYSFNATSGMKSGHIIDDSTPPSQKSRYRGFRSVKAICGKAYAVGYKGMVYRFDQIGRWTRIDDGLPEDFRIEAIDGFADSDIYVVGLNGELWHRNVDKWSKCEAPTNANLNAIKCAEDGMVYVGGSLGILLRGIGDTWEVIDHKQTGESIWDIDWFMGSLYVSTLSEVFLLNNQSLEKVDFGDDPPSTCYQLSVGDGAMWSNGERDIMCFNGSSWSRIV